MFNVEVNIVPSRKIKYVCNFELMKLCIHDFMWKISVSPRSTLDMGLRLCVCITDFSLFVVR